MSFLDRIRIKTQQERRDPSSKTPLTIEPAPDPEAAALIRTNVSALPQKIGPLDAPDATIIPLPVTTAAQEITPLTLGIAETAWLAPQGIHLFCISLQEGDALRIWAYAMGELDFYLEDRFGLPVAYGLAYSNPEGNLPECTFQALGAGEYLIKLTNHTNKVLLTALEASAAGLPAAS